MPVIAARYASGDASLAELGAEYGVSDEAVRKRLERWQIIHQAQTGEAMDVARDSLVAHLVDAKDAMRECARRRDAVGVACAREEIKYYQWLLERRRPKDFGQKQEIRDEKTIVVIDRRLGISGSVENHPQLDAQVIDVSVSQPAIQCDTERLSSEEIASTNQDNADISST